jgi:hypothetical protein
MKTPLKTLLLIVTLPLSLASCSSPFRPAQESPVTQSVRSRVGLVQGPNGTLLRGAPPDQPQSPAVQFYQ